MSDIDKDFLEKYRKRLEEAIQRDLTKATLGTIYGEEEPSEIRVGAPVPITELMVQPPEATTQSLKSPVELRLFCTKHNRDLVSDDEGKPICFKCYLEKPPERGLYFTLRF